MASRKRERAFKINEEVRICDFRIGVVAFFSSLLTHVVRWEAMITLILILPYPFPNLASLNKIRANRRFFINIAHHDMGHATTIGIDFLCLR